MLRADLEEAPPAPAPLEAPQQSVDEVETNMLRISRNAWPPAAESTWTPRRNTWTA